MITIEALGVVGWEQAIRGMRNPMNAWNKIDSGYCKTLSCESCKNIVNCDAEPDRFVVGPNDYDRMIKLVKAGTDHRKFMRMITVYIDVTAPLYWWKEFDTYKVGTVRNSCSTMHKIQAKEFTLDDFSHEQLGDAATACLNNIIELLNFSRRAFIETNDKAYWWQMIQLLPSSYNQKATVMLNYEVLANMYKSRKNHKLDEWCKFCEWIESLSYSELITGGRPDD